MFSQLTIRNNRSMHLILAVTDFIIVGGIQQVGQIKRRKVMRDTLLCSRYV
jgi:hypothetical protein